MSPEAANTIVGLIIFMPFVIFSFLRDWVAQGGAADPADAKYATPWNVGEKLKEYVDEKARYTVWVVRQSGNYERGYENVSGAEVASLIAPTLKRARIDTVAISQRRKYLSVYRTMHNHRGRNEGKKIGGFHIIRES